MLLKNPRARALATTATTAAALVATLVWIPAASAAPAPDLKVDVTSLTDTGLGDLDSDGIGFFEVHLQTLTVADAPGASGLVVSVDHGLKVAEVPEQPLPDECSVVAGTVACDTSALVDSAEDEGYFVVKVPNANSAPRGQKVTVTAQLTTPGDSAAANDSDTAFVTSAGQSDLSIAASGPTSKVSVNTNITLTYTLTNHGPYDSTVAFSDQYYWYDIDTPKGDKIVNAPLPEPKGGSDAANCTGDSPYWGCNRIVLAAGATQTYQVVVRFGPSHAGKNLVLHPAVDRDDWRSPQDPNPANDETTLRLRFDSKVPTTAAPATSTPGLAPVATPVTADPTFTG